MNKIMKYKDFQKEYSKYINQIICISCKKSFNYKCLYNKLVKEKSCYVVGKSKRHFFMRYTVYEELKEYIKSNNELNTYISELELSSSRLNRPLEVLSGEKWRASIAIGLLTGKNLFVIPWISKEIIDMYGKKWLFNLFKECCDKGKTIVLFSDSEITENNEIIKNIMLN